MVAAKTLFDLSKLAGVNELVTSAAAADAAVAQLLSDVDNSDMLNVSSDARGEFQALLDIMADVLPEVIAQIAADSGVQLDEYDIAMTYDVKSREAQAMFEAITCAAEQANGFGIRDLVFPGDDFGDDEDGAAGVFFGLFENPFADLMGEKRFA